MAVTLRPLQPQDAAALADLYIENRHFLAPFEPIRDEDFYSGAGQRTRLEQVAVDRSSGSGDSWAIHEDGTFVGRISLSNIARGPFQSANVGYWVAQAANGRGIASAALRLVLEQAFGPLGLHRVEAGTLTPNVASQRVLERNGFTVIGTAPRYLRIAGRWQDHVLLQRLSDPGE
jgi:ribosomal-protein-alanine N-acetyltransferase